MVMTRPCLDQRQRGLRASLRQGRVSAQIDGCLPHVGAQRCGFREMVILRKANDRRPCGRLPNHCEPL